MGYFDHIDCSWMAYQDEGERLFRGLQLIRSVVQLVFTDRCIIEWADYQDDYLGVQMRNPTRIRINPRPVIEPALPEQYALRVYHLIGVGIHEASHAAYTPLNWAAVLRNEHNRHRKQSGYELPRQIIRSVANWCEDVFVEGRVPGYSLFFEATARYGLSDDKCMEIVDEALLYCREDRCEPINHTAVSKRDKSKRLQNADLLALACMNLFSVLVNRPGVVNSLLPAGFAPLVDAASRLRVAGPDMCVRHRLREAIAVADEVYRFIRSMVLQDPVVNEQFERDSQADGETTEDNRPSGKASQNSDDVRAPSATGFSDTKGKTIQDRINTAIRNRISIRRDKSDPTKTERARNPHSRLDYVQIVAMALAADKDAQAARISMIDIAATQTTLDRSGRALLQDKHVRIIDSTRETLPDVEEVERRTGCSLEKLAEYLLTKHNVLVNTLVNRMNVRHGYRPRIRFGKEEGELDPEELPDIRYFREGRTDAANLDICVLVDESGSMKEDNRWEMAAIASLVLEKTFHPFFARGLRLRAYGFTTGQDNDALLFRHYDSGIPRLLRPEALAWSYPKSLTPTGMALAAARREMLRSRRANSRQCLLLLTDGEPYAQDYEGKSAMSHVEQEVADIVHRGVRFACLQIGSAPRTGALLSNRVTEHDMAQMFGDRWQAVHAADELPATIVRLVMQWFAA